MSNSPASLPAGQASSAAASALLEQHGAALRTYLGQLPGMDPRRVEAVIREIGRGVEAAGEIDDDPVVWLFARARRQAVGTGQRGDVLLADAAESDESIETEDSRVAVHRAFARLTGKQQEALRLRFQFGFTDEEVARITGLPLSGAAGLSQHALGRIVQALPVEPGQPARRISDPRIIAYAFDEMEEGEKRAFVEAVPDGKALLETSEAIRRAARELTQILEAGVPPRRRRKRRGVRPWARVAAGIAALLATGGFFWWQSGRQDDRAAAPASATVSKERPTAPEDLDAPAPPTPRKTLESGPTARTKSPRELRPGEAEWERKPFGRGIGQSAGMVGPGAGEGAWSSPADGGEATTDDAVATQSQDVGQGMEPDAGNAEEGDHPTVVWPAAVAGAGAAQSEPVQTGGTGGAGATAGSTSVQSQVVFAGKTAGGLAPKNPARTVAAPLPGLPALKHLLARRVWPSPVQVRAAALLRQGPPERSAPGPAREPMSVQTEMAPSPFTPGRQILRIVVKARPAPPPARPPANLVLAIDVSDSMRGPNRLPLVQEGMRLLAERLRPDDRVAVVSYASEAREVRPSAPVGEGGGELRGVLGSLVPAGRTNGYEGLRLAYATARAAKVAAGLNAVILCTDGNFNLGETDDAVLADLAEQAAADGIRLSVFGFGRSDRNDLRLELLAQHGGGRSCYVNTREDAERLLAEQVGGLLGPVATDVACRVTFNPAPVAAVRRLGGEDDASVAELLPGRNLSMLYELELKHPAGGEWGRVTVDYADASTHEAVRLTQVLEGASSDWAQAGPGFKFATAMGELERILQGEAAAGGPALARLEAWVRQSLPDDSGGYRSELLETIAAAGQVAAH